MEIDKITIYEVKQRAKSIAPLPWTIISYEPSKGEAVCSMMNWKLKHMPPGLEREFVIVPIIKEWKTKDEA